MGRAHKFRFGLVLVALSTGPGSRWTEFARRAEDLGYSSLLISDHFSGFHPSPATAMTWAAAATKTLRVGTLVLGNDYRHPAMVAKDAATLDLLSDGRVELGMGAGWMRSDYDELGLDYDATGVRIERLAEALAIIKSCWRGEPFDFEGEHYTIRNYTGLPKPVQQPLPIIVGGGRPRVLRLAGAEADIVGVHVSTAAPNAMADTQHSNTLRKIGWVKEGAGPRFDDIELQMSIGATITDDPLGTAESMAAKAGVPVQRVRESASLLGTVDDVCDELQRRRDEWGVSYIVVPVETCEDFAPVVARLAGT